LRRARKRGRQGHLIDHAAIARACGVKSARIEAPGDILPALRRAITSGEPWLVEILTDPDAHPPLSLYDGTLDRPEEASLEAFRT